MSGEKRLAVTFFVTVLILAGEVVGGYLSNSLALLSDAGHRALSDARLLPFEAAAGKRDTLD